MVQDWKDINGHYLPTDINVTDIKYVMVKIHMLYNGGPYHKSIDS